MNFDEFKTFLSENKENADVLKELNKYKKNPSTLETINTIKGTEEFKNTINTNIEQWKNDNLGSLLNEEIEKRFPEKTEKDIELENVKAEIENLKKEKRIEQLKNKSFKIASEKKLPSKLIDYFIGDDEEKTEQNIKILEDELNTYVNAAVKERLGSNTPPSSKDEKEIDPFLLGLKNKEV